MGLSVDLFTLKPAQSFSDIKKPLPMSNQSSHWPKATALTLEAFHHPSSYDPPPLSSQTSDSVSQAHLSTFPNSAPSPILPEGFFYALLFLHSQFKESETIKIPVPLQFAGFVPTFEFLLILLLTGHLLFFSSYIFFISWCIHGFVPSWNFLFLRSGICILLHFAFTVAYHNG